VGYSEASVRQIRRENLSKPAIQAAGDCAAIGLGAVAAVSRLAAGSSF
jgi:hypothetical protein